MGHPVVASYQRSMKQTTSDQGNIFTTFIQIYTYAFSRAHLPSTIAAEHTAVSPSSLRVPDSPGSPPGSSKESPSKARKASLQGAGITSKLPLKQGHTYRSYFGILICNLYIRVTKILKKRLLKTMPFVTGITQPITIGLLY